MGSAQIGDRNSSGLLVFQESGPHRIPVPHKFASTPDLRSPSAKEQTLIAVKHPDTLIVTMVSAACRDHQSHTQTAAEWNASRSASPAWTPYWLPPESSTNTFFHALWASFPAVAVSA